MKKNIVLLPGDGIGPEVTAQAVRVLEVVAAKYGYSFHYTTCLIGAAAIEATGSPLPEDTAHACLDADAVLLGAVGHPRFDQDPSAPVRPEQGLLGLRQLLQVYANIRPVVPHPALAHRTPFRAGHTAGVDLLIFRELTGGSYFGEKGTTEDGSAAYDTCRYTRAEIVRTAELAFLQAQRRKRKLTLVDKANVLETSRLWRRTVTDLSASFPDVAVDFLYVDNAAMQLILDPARFDVILTENMFGDILSDEAAVLAGSLGMLPSASVGQRAALFEPVHGSYPEAAGKDIANPFAAILSVSMMLDHFGAADAAAEVRDAVSRALYSGAVTRDISEKQYYTTSQAGSAVCGYLSGDGTGVTSDDENIRLGQSTII